MRYASHAWVQGPGLGSWIGHDPTNGSVDRRERHVVVARGRDYADVTPFAACTKGVVAPERLDVDVDYCALPRRCRVGHWPSLAAPRRIR